MFAPKKIMSPRDGYETFDYLALPEAKDCVWWPENTCRPDGIVMLGCNSSTSTTLPRRALTVAYKAYNNVVPKDKCLDQINSSDLSRAYLTQQDGVGNTKEKRLIWCKNGLHETICLRVIVSLPAAGYKIESPGDKLDHKRIKIRESNSDVIVHLDKTNIYKLLGKENSSGVPKGLYDILAYITNTKKEEWGGTGSD